MIPPWTGLLTKRRAELRHAFRVAVAASLSFALAKLLGLPQGYWSVITAVVVVQTSIGATLGASRDRLIGTGVGALVGALAAGLGQASGSSWGELGALAVSVAVLGYAASVRPSLKIAPVTAVIMIVGGTSAQHGFALTAILRVSGIALGGVLGVLVTLFVFPARARDAVRLNAQQVLVQLSDLLALYAERLEGEDHAAEFAPLHDRLRATLAKIETAVNEATRETAARLTGARVTEAMPRTLWRLRNDAVMIGRASSHDWPALIAQRLAAPAATVLRSQAEQLRALSAVLDHDDTAPEPGTVETLTEFRAAFERLEHEVSPGALTFELLEQVFGLAYALEAFNQHLSDLGDRISEFSAGRAE